MLKDKIKRERIKQHFSIYELSRQTGHSTSTLYGIENGQNRNPGFRIMCDIANTLNLSLDDLAKEVAGKQKNGK